MINNSKLSLQFHAHWDSIYKQRRDFQNTNNTWEDERETIRYYISYEY